MLEGSKLTANCVTRSPPSDEIPAGRSAPDPPKSSIISPMVGMYAVVPSASDTRHHCPSRIGIGSVTSRVAAVSPEPSVTCPASTPVICQVPDVSGARVVASDPFARVKPGKIVQSPAFRVNDTSARVSATGSAAR